MGKTYSRLSQEQIHELHTQTRFDKKEIQAWHQGFFKECYSGYMDRAEFVKIYKLYFPFAESHKFAEYVFNVIDTDKNNIIDFKEYLIAFSVIVKGSFEEKTEWSFRLFDLDNDGYISYDELLTVVEAMFKMTAATVRLSSDEDTPEKRVTKVMSLMSKNKEDRLSLDDFRHGCAKDPTLMQAFSVYQGYHTKQ